MVTHTVLIIGGGAAGLSAALKLAAHGHAVMLYERRPALGGRLSNEGDGHRAATLWGWSRTAHATLTALGTPPAAALGDAAPLSFVTASDRRRRAPRPLLAGPPSLLSLLRFSLLPVGDRWRMFSRLEHRWEQGQLAPPDLDSRTASHWLGEMGQSPAALQEVWAPLCRFLLGEEATDVSAAAFLDAVTRGWLRGRQHSALQILRRDLHSLFVEPARAQLAQSHVRIRHEAIEQLRCDARRATGALVAGGGTVTADWYIAAVPPQALYPLLPERAVTRFAYFQQLAQLSTVPWITVSLSPGAVALRPSVQLLSGRPFHWVVTRPERGGEPARIWLTAVGSGGLLAEADDKLHRLATDELSRTISGPFDVQGFQVSRQPEATVALRPGTAALRPLPQSPFPNLLLAGDWTDTGLPPSLESAVVSGERCADIILRNVAAGERGALHIT